MTVRHGLEDVPSDVDVVIAGGGPSGLFLAADLEAYGVSSVVVEPRAELDWLHPRAKTTNARTMTHLRRLGLADRLRAAAPIPVEYADSVAFCTSLVGHELTRFHEAFQLVADRYALQPESGQQVAQPVVEQVLRDHVASRADAHLVLGAELVDVDLSDPDQVVAVVASGESVRQVRGRYLVGADGVSSRVRKSLGIRLEGSSAGKSNLGLLFRSEALGAVVRHDPAVQYWVVGRRYAGMVGPMDLDGTWWAIVQGYDPGRPEFADVAREEILRELIGADVDIHVEAEDPWTARMLLAPRYRSDRCFLVGDAAHANPPWGGHGFNTCIGDAANLAWKLAADLHGWGGRSLLDSYEAERRPVARRTIDDAAANGTVLADDYIEDLLDQDGPEGDAVRAETARSLVAAKTSEFLSLGLVLGYSYESSPLVTPSGSSCPAPDPVRYEPTAAPGALLPHAWLDDDVSLYDALGRGFTVLVDGDGPAVDTSAAAAVADRLGIPLTVRTVTATGGSFTAGWEAPSVLVRPDQHVAWRGDGGAALAVALERASGRGASSGAVDGIGRRGVGAALRAGSAQRT
ncbi:FAD-dependent monooxygenase [Mumia qirimensis]|uniref:FAD-dependent monooxygenase n=1 Tax=Mumia qirimensis TaxID=3234852 RepID=UPI00351CE23D